MTMPVIIDVRDEAWGELPDVAPLAERAVEAALAYSQIDPAEFEVSLLFAGDAEAAQINSEWRNKSYAPNVLSFPAPPLSPVPGAARPLGDIVLAAGTVAREAGEQKKPLETHVAHLIVHGMLHLLGYDHMNDEEAAHMEGAEIEILRGLGIPNPYLT